MRLHRIFLLLKNNDWRRSPAEPPRSRPSGRRRRCAVQAFWPLAKTLRRQNSLLSSTVIAGGWRRQSRNPKQKAVAFATAFCFGVDNITKICDLTRWRRSPAERSRIAKEPHLLGVVLRMVETTELESVTFRVWGNWGRKMPFKSLDFQEYLISGHWIENRSH